MVSQVLLPTLVDMFLAFLVAIGWSILFNSPRKVLLIAGLLGGLGHSLRYLIIEGFNVAIVPATLAGTVLIGLLGLIAARRVDTPPVVFTMPACITMIPGLYAYHAMLGFVKMTNADIAAQEPNLIPQTAHYFVLTISLLFSLSIGITIGSLLFRKKTAREIKLSIPRLSLKRKRSHPHE